MLARAGLESGDEQGGGDVAANQLVKQLAGWSRLLILPRKRNALAVHSGRLRAAVVQDELVVGDVGDGAVVGG